MPACRSTRKIHSLDNFPIVRGIFASMSTACSIPSSRCRPADERRSGQIRYRVVSGRLSSACLMRLPTMAARPAIRVWGERHQLSPAQEGSRRQRHLPRFVVSPSPHRGVFPQALPDVGPNAPRRSSGRFWRTTSASSPSVGSRRLIWFGNTIPAAWPSACWQLAAWGG